MRGLPSIRDTRVTVSAVLGQLAAGVGIDELADYPHLERKDVLATPLLRDQCNGAVGRFLGRLGALWGPAEPYAA